MDAPITDINGVPRIFFIVWYTRDSQRHPTAPRLTDDQRAALSLAERIANDSRFNIEMKFEPGDVQLLNNSTVCTHAKSTQTMTTPIVDGICSAYGSPPRRP